MKRRTFLTVAAGAAACQIVKSQPTAEDFEPAELGISELDSGLRSGKWTSAKLAELYLARINQLDRDGPHLSSVIELNPEVQAVAAALDRERKQGRLRGPLHGIPILIKDNIEVTGRMSTSAGSLALANWHPPHDAFVAARLRAAGALILGKTNLSEWANIRSTHSSSGWSARGSQTKNPYRLSHNPSGSSSGSAVAVAANLCAVAVGTETDGSVISPASINGIVGVKPTVGLVSRSGIIPISHVQDTAGPMCRRVRDAAILLSVMAGRDARDPATQNAKNTPADYTKFLDPEGLRGARLGIPRKFYEGNATLNRFLNQAIDTLKAAGAEIVDPADLPFHGQWSETSEAALFYEFKKDVNAYLSKLPPSLPVHSLADVIAFNNKNRDREMPIFGQEIFLAAQKSDQMPEAKYLQARRECVRLAGKDGIDAVLAAHRLDALVTLSSGPAWPTDWKNGDHDTGSCTTPAAIAGYPHITVPAGFVSEDNKEELPVGLSFFGAAWSEPVLFRLAYAFENATKARRQPQFLA